MLSSGVWSEKHQNTFAEADLIVLDRIYMEENADDIKVLYQMLYDTDKILRSNNINYYRYTKILRIGHNSNDINRKKKIRVPLFPRDRRF